MNTTEITTALESLIDSLSGVKAALEGSPSADSDKAFSQGMLEAADLIEGWFLAGLGRRYTIDEESERSLCQQLQQAIHARAASEDYSDDD